MGWRSCTIGYTDGKGSRETGRMACFPAFCLSSDFVSTGGSDVLINKDWVAVGVHYHETGGTCRTHVRLAH